mmetsp:Transcript_27029/g.27271  ORF Transcript_27029/g.27271 Transcript_27029/m.27271 type:complete len:388 (-) Transcript_27029:309-1472(-)
MSSGGKLARVDGEIPQDGVYFRAPGVSSNLRSFPVSGPVNCYKDHFKVPDAGRSTVPLRSVIPDDKKDWDVEYPDYTSHEYITELVLLNSRNRNPNGWADPEPGIDRDDPQYTKLFKRINPVWLRGLRKDDCQNMLHPYGRCGIRGQGVLGNRHVNEAIDPITVFHDVKQNVIKVLLIKRNPVDTKDVDWAIPGGMVDYKNENDAYTVPLRLNKLLSTFDVKAPTLLKDTQRELRDNALRELKEETGFSGNVSYQKLIAQMYSDDTRSTDTTWIVTSVFLLVTDSSEAVAADGVETSEARWVPFKYAMENLEFFASHKSMLIAALRYFITNSFADRKISGCASHRLAFEHLRDMKELDLPQTFEEMIGGTPIRRLNQKPVLAEPKED